MRRQVAVLLAVMVVGATACSSSAVDDAEGELVSGFLHPLVDAGVDVSVGDTCRLDLPSVPITSPWHLEARLVVDAEFDVVADLLEGEGMVLRRDRDRADVQQVRGAPTEGWNGVVEETDAGVLIAVTRNGVDVADRGGAIAWAEGCRR